MENDNRGRVITWDELELEDWINDTDSRRRYQEIAKKYGIEPLQVVKITCAVWWSDPAEGGKLPQALDKVREVAREIMNDNVVIEIIRDDTHAMFKEGISLEDALARLPGLLRQRHQKALDIATNFLKDYFEAFTKEDRELLLKRLTQFMNK